MNLHQSIDTIEHAAADFALGTGDAFRQQFFDGAKQLAGARINSEHRDSSTAEGLGNALGNAAIYIGLNAVLKKVPAVGAMAGGRLAGMITGGALGFLSPVQENQGLLERAEKSALGVATIGALEFAPPLASSIGPLSGKTFGAGLSRSVLAGGIAGAINTEGTTAIDEHRQATWSELATATAPWMLTGGVSHTISSGIWRRETPQSRAKVIASLHDEAERIMHGNALRGPSEFKPGTVGNCYISSRSLEFYKEDLLIPDSELNNGKRKLDIGAGAMQNFAREVKDAGYKSTVVSVDPRLELSDAEDLQRLWKGIGKTTAEERLFGRRFPMPLTVADRAEQLANLPHPDGSYGAAYHYYSTPMYFGSTVGGKDHELERQLFAASLRRMTQALEPGGIARYYPIYPDQIDMVENTLKQFGFEKRPIDFLKTSKDEILKLLPNKSYATWEKLPSSAYDTWNRGRVVRTAPLANFLILRNGKW